MIKIAPLPAPLSNRDPAVLIATGFGSGRLAPAPGTWGSVAAWLLALAMPKALLVVAIVLALAGGWWAVTSFQKQSETHDSGMIVIDEWAGVWIAMLFTACSCLGPALLALFFFRVFDVLKPWPIRWLDRELGGAAGVMLDDVAAGLAAGMCVWGVTQWTGM